MKKKKSMAQWVRQKSKTSERRSEVKVEEGSTPYFAT